MKLRSVAGLAGAFALGAGSMAMLGQAAQAAKPEDAGRARLYRWLGLFGDTLTTLEAQSLEPIDPVQAVQTAIDGMLHGMDAGGDYIPPEAFNALRNRTVQEAGVGFSLQADPLGLRVTSVSADGKADIQPGDYVIAVSGAEVGPYGEVHATSLLQGPANTPVTVTIVRAGRTHDVTLVRRFPPQIVLTPHMEGDVGYVPIRNLDDGTVKNVREAVTGMRRDNPEMRGLVLDLRNSPGGLLDQSVGVAGLFLADGEVLLQTGRDPKDVERYRSRGPDILGGLPIVVLVNGATASGGEIVAGALQDRGRARLVGMATEGRGKIQTVIPMRGGVDGAIKITTSEVRLPSGRSFDRTGLTPDVIIPQAVGAVGDPQLTRALELLKG